MLMLKMPTKTYIKTDLLGKPQHYGMLLLSGGVFISAKKVVCKPLSLSHVSRAFKLCYTNQG